MIELAGTWDLGYSAPITEMDHWWAVMRTYNIEALHMTPISGLRHKMLVEHDNWNFLKETHLTPVFVDETAGVALAEFEHPKDALYIFGKANYAPFLNYGEGHLAVRIETPTLGMLWPHQAAAIVLQDHYDNHVSNR